MKKMNNRSDAVSLKL